jgi:glucuronoarabinoxylan endo-1,4-beta-xylanase
MAILRRWRAFGLEMLYYSVVNEPGYQRSGLWSGQYILNVIKLMGPRLRAEGFKTKFVITDDLNATEAYKRCRIILADAEARQYVGALAFHLYDEPISQVSQMKELADRYGLPLWMTEYSQNDPFDWAVTMHQLISDYNVSAVDYMWGFFGQWTGGDKLINLRHTGARYLGYTLTKHYYVMGQFSKYVRPGFRRIKADSTDSTVKVTAYTDGSNVVVVSINQSNAEEIVKFQFVDSGAPVKLAASRTSKEGDSAALPDHLVRESTFTATLPGRSITTFYGVSGK